MSRSDLLSSFIFKQTGPKTDSTTCPIQPKLTKKAEADIHGLSVGMFGFNSQAGDTSTKQEPGRLNLNG